MSTNAAELHSRPAASPDERITTLGADWISASWERICLIPELAAAEARLAAMSVSAMAFLGTLSAAFVLGAWGLMLAGLIRSLEQVGLPVWIMLMLLAALHVVVAGLLWNSAMRLGRHVQFRETRRQLAKYPDREVVQ